MGSRSIGELLLRPHSLSHVSIAHPLASVCVRRTAPSWSTSSCRSISNSTPSQGIQPQAKQAPSADTQHQSNANSASDAIDKLLGVRSPPTAQPNSTRAAGATPARLFGANFSAKPSNSLKRTPLQFNDMLDPDAKGVIASPKRQSIVEIPESEKVYPRLNAAYGRTVVLDPARGRDIVRGIAMLGTLCGRNKIRADLFRQRFHERNGLKRKRLKSERWRARFKDGFQQVTSRVQELTRKGW